MKRKPAQPLNIAVVGIVRNNASTLAKDVRRLERAFLGSHLSWFLVESDSSDLTLDTLRRLQSTTPDFDFVSLGDLEGSLPHRTERLAHCRNRCVTEISVNPKYRGVDFVCVADFDGVNSHISFRAVQTCWSRLNWDGCFPNQRGPYYDVWALRHPEWSPDDCWDEYRRLRASGLSKRRSREIAVYARMKRIRPGSEWIPVQSAFGGVGIYRREVFVKGRYSGVINQRPVCEHVPFHEALIEDGARLFINPDFINARVVEHAQAVAAPSWRRRMSRLVS